MIRSPMPSTKALAPLMKTGMSAPSCSPIAASSLRSNPSFQRRLRPQALGIAEGALDIAIAYTKERKQFGRSIAQQQNTQFKLADMAARIEAAQLLVYKAAMAKATQKVYSVEAAKAKLFAAETAMAVTTEVVQLFGGYGYIREYDVERMMRDAKITEIYEGTSEVQRMVISGAPISTMFEILISRSFCAA